MNRGGSGDTWDLSILSLTPRPTGGPKCCIFMLSPLWGEHTER